MLNSNAESVCFGSKMSTNNKTKTAGKNNSNVRPPEPTKPAPPDPKPTSFVASATESDVVTATVKTTRELYMESNDVKSN